MSAVKLVCGLHDHPRYLAHLATTGPSGRLALTFAPSKSNQGMKHKDRRVQSRSDARLYELTCCGRPMRLTEAHAHLAYDAGQLADAHTLDLPAFLNALPYYCK